MLLRFQHFQVKEKQKNQADEDPKDKQETWIGTNTKTANK